MRSGRLRARHRVQFVVARADVEFRRPARFDDRLEVDGRVLGLHRVPLRLAQGVRGADRELLCHAEVRVGCVDAETFRPRRIPPFLQQELGLEH